MAGDQFDVNTPQKPAALSYSDQVAFAREYIETWSSGGADVLFGGRNITSTDGWAAHKARSLGWRLLNTDPDSLLSLSGTSLDHFDALREVTALMIKKGEFDELPTDYQYWVGKYLIGEVDRPKSRAGRPQSFGLHYVIKLTISILLAKGMTATRNDASEPVSACDAVADALAELGLEPTTFEAVKRIWLK